MPRLRQAFPDIRIELVTERHLINLTRREADISLSFAELQGPRLIAEKIGTFVLNLYASPAYIARMNRTKKQVEEAQKVPLKDLPDPQTDEQRTKPGHEQWLVVIGICTHLGCIPIAHAEGEQIVAALHRLQADEAGAELPPVVERIRAETRVSEAEQ